MKIMRAASAAIPAIKNNPQKVLILRVLDGTEVPESG
jgi:hypothetical protein